MLEEKLISNQLYAVCEVADESGVDEISMNVLRKDLPPFLFPIRDFNINGAVELRYAFSAGTRLNYFSWKMRKNDFVILMKNLLSPFFGCGDWFLLSSNFVLDENHILIDTDTFSVKYIYLPLKQQVNTTEKIMEFFENFIVRCELVDDPAFLMRLLRVIKTNSVSLKPLYDEINTAAGRNDNRSGSDSASMNAAPVQPVPVQQAPAPAPAPAPVPTPASAPAKPASPFSFKKAEPAPAPAPMAPMPQAPAASVKQAAENSRENDLMANLFGGAAVEKSKPAKQPKPQKEKPVKEKKSGGFLRFDKKHEDAAIISPANPVQPAAPAYGGFQQQAAPAAPYVPQQYTGNEFTAVDESSSVDVGDPNKVNLRLDDPAGFSVPSMLELDVSRGFATLGRFDKTGRKTSDFNFDSTLTFVSRQHCRFEKAADGSVLLIDLSSKNGTYVNGQRLVPNAPQKLNSGDRIMFSANHRLSYIFV